MKKVVLLVFLCCLILTGCKAQPKATVVSLEEAQQNYLEKVDVDYAYNFALSLEENKDNQNLGYRTAGSSAEFANGELIKQEMEAIGLQNVTKDEFTLDGWTFEKAVLTYLDENNQEITTQLGAYQTQFVTNGFQDYELVYANQGTEDDLKDLDVTGKLVLIDINQRENWWVNYPAYEAYLHQAAAVIVAQDGGYAEISETALNAQDICGPEYAPAFSISRKDADALIASLQSTTTNSVTVALDAVSEVEKEVKSYNIIGEILGKNPEGIIVLSAHYDSYFTGFQDDHVAIGEILGIAKGLIDSGYQPEHTIVIAAMAAEEWGAINTRYDWSTGAYNQVFNNRPEWSGKVIANLNFELCAMDEGDTNQIRSAYELKTFNEAMFSKVPVIDGIFENGIEIIVPTYTWSDDFSFSIAGIPANVTALRGEFAASTYHSDYDTRETYSEKAYQFNLNFYGLLTLEYDRCAISPLDFSVRFEDLLATIDPMAFELAQIDQADLIAATIEAKELGTKAYEQIKQANEAYSSALDANELTEAEKIFKDSTTLNQDILQIFKDAQDSLVKLTWEDRPIFPHEHAQNNLINLENSINALQANDPILAVDEYLWAIDNNWYAYDWSKETFDYFTNYVLDQPEDRLYWGANRVLGHVDLYDVINSLLTKIDNEETDFTWEIAELTKAKENQINLLKTSVEQEIIDLQQLSAQLAKIS